MTETQSTGVDRRALRLSLGGGTLSGLLFVWPALRATLTHQPIDQNDRAIAHSIGNLIGLLLVPLLVTAWARHRSFLWGLLALALHLFWTLADRIAAGNGAGALHDLRVNTPFHIVPLLLVCAPVSLCRYALRLHREHAARVRLAEQAPQHSPQEDIWPPPPTRPAL